VIVTYEEEKWLLKVQVLFYYNEWDLEKLIFGRKKKKKATKSVKEKRKSTVNKFNRFLRVLKTFKIMEWQIAIDTGDPIRNAWLYPLYFSRRAWKHLYINFIDENYLVIKIRNTPWKLAFAFMR
jgi:hypothetical protein